MLHAEVLTPASLDKPDKRAQLDALLERVKNHPSLYAYHLTDEPAAEMFPTLARTVGYLREKDPAHLPYINLLPTYASNAQLGIKGPKVDAYREHLRQYCDVVKPALLSYDHYQFTNVGDAPDYFLNLCLMREKAIASGLPFLNIVQAACWGPTENASPHNPRVPGPEEMRFLVYSTLAYGAQGISYYVYCFPGHNGGIVKPDGTPTPIYHALKTLNREFLAIATQLQPLKSQGVYHAGMQPPGVTALLEKSAFTFDPPIPAVNYAPGARLKGVVLSQFGTGDTTTHLLVMNLDYKRERSVGLSAPTPLEIFDATTGQWSPSVGSRIDLNLAGGMGKLLRVRP
jgi:hypothetical protein